MKADKSMRLRTISSVLVGLLSLAGNAQVHMVDTAFRVLTYGLPRFEYQNATYVIGQKWGIEHYAVAGCVVSKHLVDSVKRENKRVMARIADRYGAGWEDRFDAEVQLEYEREKVILAKVKELPYIQARQKQMEAEGNGLHYLVMPGPDGDEVLVHGYAPWEGNTEWLMLYTFKVDNKSGSVTMVSDTPQKE